MEKSNWTKEEFIAYILLYATKANFVETPEEKEIILSKVNAQSYQKIHKELDKDNDFQSIQKILANLSKFNYTKRNIDLLISEIRMLYLSDGECNSNENTMFLGLKRLLKDKTF